MNNLKVEAISVTEAMDRVRSVYAGREADFKTDLTNAEAVAKQRMAETVQETVATKVERKNKM